MAFTKTDAVDVIPGPPGANLEIVIHTPDNQPAVALVVADLCGPLAIHATYGGKWPPWTVTHIKTGMRVYQFESRFRARDFVRDAEGLDWEFDDGEKIPESTRLAVRKRLGMDEPGDEIPF